MKILATQTVDCQIKVYTADWIESYSDGMPLSSNRVEYESPEERLAELEGYDESQIDIDVDKREYGWEFGYDVKTVKVTVEVVQDDDGKITVRQKQ